MPEKKEERPFPAFLSSRFLPYGVMADEIERKFLVVGDGWRGGASGLRYVQGYLSRDPERIVRVRRAGEKAFLTIKGLARGVSRKEFEYSVPLADAEELLRLCLRPLIEKVRTVVEYHGKRWEVDEFAGENAGLVVAEIELTREEEPFDRPPWAGQEVSDDPRYSNSSLCERPFTKW